LQFMAIRMQVLKTALKKLLVILAVIIVHLKEPLDL
jgi:hypothetical protein